MAQKSSFFARFFIISLALAAVAPQAVAEFACSAEVSYRWVKGGTAGAAHGAAVQVGSGEKAKGPASNPTTSAGTAPAAGGVVVVRYAAVERKGTDEAAAKQALGAEIGRQKIRASEACQRDHEGFGACVGTKLSTKSSLLNSLSFSVRAEVEKAILDECREQQGACQAVESTEPQCKEVIATEAPAAGADAKKGDSKKPEGKKK
jgi:hypothetical protein